MQKKRNKKYDPKQIVKQKVHKLQMSWEANDANRVIEIHHLLGGVNTTKEVVTPLTVWMNAYKGDLALALKTETISSDQSFHIVSRVHAIDEVTGETSDYEIQVASPAHLELWEFLGDEDAEIYLANGEQWLGFHGELYAYLEKVSEGKQLRLLTNHCCLTCFTSFKSFAHEREFKSTKMLKGYGVGIDS